MRGSPSRRVWTRSSSRTTAGGSSIRSSRRSRFRRGTDVFKALALGAAAVLVGRPACWGLAAAGEDGVVDVLRILRSELENTMVLAGTRSLGDITGARVARA